MVTTLARAQPADAPGPPPPPPASPPAGVVPPVLLSDPFVQAPEGTAEDVTVVLVVTINPDGSVRSAVPDELREPFSTQASTAALTWRFEPAKLGNKTVAAKIRFEVVFHAPVPAPPAAPSPTPSGTGAPAPLSAQPAVAPGFEEVTVRGARADPSRTVSLSRAEVREIPGTFGDPFRAIEIMPGVTPIVSGLPFFFVRGAPPGDVGYFLDGIRVPYLFHVGAGPSVVHP